MPRQRGSQVGGSTARTGFPAAVASITLEEVGYVRCETACSVGKDGERVRMHAMGVASVEEIEAGCWDGAHTNPISPIDKGVVRCLYGATRTMQSYLDGVLDREGEGERGHSIEVGVSWRCDEADAAIKQSQTCRSDSGPDRKGRGWWVADGWVGDDHCGCRAALREV